MAVQPAGAPGSDAGAPRYLKLGVGQSARESAHTLALSALEVTRAAGESRAAGGLFAWDAIDRRRSAFT